MRAKTRELCAFSYEDPEPSSVRPPVDVRRVQHDDDDAAIRADLPEVSDRQRRVAFV